MRSSSVRARRALAVALALAALAPAGCSDDGPAEGEARLEVDGQALLVRRGGDREVVADDRATVRPGDRVEVTEGTATMDLRAGTRLELRAGLGDAADSRVLMGKVPELESGDLLVATPASTRVEAAGTTVEVERGSAQVSRSLGMGVASYDAAVSLDSAGQDRAVPSLREMRVPALGRPPQVPRPLSYDGRDPWDRRFLGAAIELGDRLESIATGYTQNLNEGEGRTPGFFRLVLPGLEDEAEFGAQLIDLDRPPGETLVGAAIADLGRRGGFAQRWASVFDFKDAGAHWGLVALDQAVSRAPLLGSIEDAVASSPLAFGDPLPRSDPRRGETAAPPPVVSPPSTEPPTTSTPPPPPTTEPPPQPPPADPVTPVLDPVLEPAVDTLVGMVDGLLGALDPPPGG